MARERDQDSVVKSKTLDRRLRLRPRDDFPEEHQTTRSRRRSTISRQDHGKVKGVCSNLRDNPGGPAESGVKSRMIFLDGGLIVYTRGRQDNQQQKYFSHNEEDFDDYPMVVLVNGGSASASGDRRERVARIKNAP